jgi:hypothetical protein
MMARGSGAQRIEIPEELRRGFLAAYECKDLRYRVVTVD